MVQDDPATCTASCVAGCAPANSTCPAACSAGCQPAVTTAPITAAGSSASFSPLPASALAGAGGAPVRTFFTSLAFDPNSAPDAAAAAGRGGVTQLSLTSAAAPAGSAGGRRHTLQAGGAFTPLAVAGLPTLIQFSLPLPTNLVPGAGLQAACTFWDEALGNYSTAGCVGLPNPAPPGLPLAFKPSTPFYTMEDSRTAAGSGPPATATLSLGFNFSDPSDTLLQRAWFVNESVPFFTANCIVRFLDCSNASQVNVSIYPDPQRPISIPAVGCGGVLANRTLRVYYNDPWIRPPLPCALWDAGAQAQLLAAPPCSWNTSAAAFQGPGCSVTCYWNATAQAFAGGGCLVAPATSCGCRHLTAFASSSAPTISVCSASDMLSLTPGDIINKLRTFLYVIGGLFVGMHAGAAAGYAIDRADRKAVIQHLMHDCGFRELGPDGA